MLNIIVCDDELAVVQQIHNYITGYYINYPAEYNVQVFTSGLEIFKEAKNRTANVIFLDIDLQDSNGIKIAKAIRQFDKQVKIIFITNHKNFKGLAFSVRAFGYVDKPVTSEQICEQLHDIESYIQDAKSDVSKKFNTTDGAVNLVLNDIMYFEREDRNTKIITFGRNYITRDKISDLESQLCNHNFVSLHVSFLVNLDYVSDCKNYIVSMVDKMEIPLSQRKSTVFRSKLHAFLARAIDFGGMK